MKGKEVLSCIRTRCKMEEKKGVVQRRTSHFRKTCIYTDEVELMNSKCTSGTFGD